MPFCAPQIVYSNAFLGQTSALSETLYTLPADGVYRISFAFGAAPSGVTSIWSASIGATPKYAGVGYSLPGYGGNTQDGLYGAMDAVNLLGSGSSITLTVSLSAGTSTSYDVWVIIEQVA